MTTLFKASAAAFGLAMLAAAIPAAAAPVPSQAAVLSSGVTDGLTAVRAVRKRQRNSDQYIENSPGQYGADTVGSLRYDESGYAYNRVSGQRYQKCMEDLGYGRVRPCDAGDTQ